MQADSYNMINISFQNIAFGVYHTKNLMIDTAGKQIICVYVFTNVLFLLSEFIAARNAAIALGVILVLSLAANISLLILLLRKGTGSTDNVKFVFQKEEY